MGTIFRIGKSLLILIAISLSVAEVHSQSTAQEIYDENAPAVVVIFTYDKNKDPLSQGSGVQLNDEGLVVTNFHVMEGAYYAKIIFSDNTEFEVKYVYTHDKDHDLALIKHYGKKREHVEISSSDDVHIGEVCYAIGSPKGFQNTISPGLLSNIIRDGSEYVFQISNPISPGSSGGGLFNDDGKLIGITFLTFKDGQNINFAIPSKYVSELMLKPFKQTSLLEFQAIIGGAVILKPEKKEDYSKRDPEPETEIEELEVDDEASFDIETGFSYDIGGRYIYMSSVLNNKVPSYIQIRKGFAATLSYWFSSYGGLGITFQKQDVFNNNTGARNNLHLYKGELLIRTSEHPLRATMGFGIGLANSYFQTADDNPQIVIGKVSNQFTASAMLGIEYMIVNRFSISVSLPVDYILVSDTKSLEVFLASPSVGLNVVF